MSIEPFIKSSNIKASLEFYSDILDFKVIQAPDPNPEAFLSVYGLLEREGSFLHISEHSGDGVFGNVLYIRVKNLDATYQAFLNNGLQVQDKAGITLEPVTQTWGMKEFYVTDPDGNRIRFGQPIV